MKTPPDLLTFSENMAFLGPSLRRKRVIERPAMRALVAVLVSLAVNGALLVVLGLAGAFEIVKPVKQERVDLAALTAEQWKANRAIAGAQPPDMPTPASPAPKPMTPEAAKPAPEEKPPPEQRPRGQVVDVTPGNDKRPGDTRFLAEHDNRVEKETRSRFAGTQLYKNRAAAPSAGGEKKAAGQGGTDAESQDAREARGPRGGKQAQNQPAPEKREPPAPGEDGDRVAMLDRPKLPTTSPGRPGAGDEEGLGAPGPAQPGQQGKQKKGDPRLLPSVESMSKIAGGPSNDLIDGDVEEGDATALNTRNFRFATFWNRFKQDVSDHWMPAVRYDLTSRDPRGSTFGTRAWMTGLHIVLDRGGAVKDIRVVAPSGLDFLDRVAMKSVRDAAPFYNVPPALLDAKGELAFDFGFLVGNERGIPVRPRYHPAE